MDQTNPFIFQKNGIFAERPRKISEDIEPKEIEDDVTVKPGVPDLTEETDKLKPKVKVKIYMEPSILVVEVPYFFGTAKIKDKPPIAPDVNFVPYKDNPKQFLILLNRQTGHYRFDPVFFGSEERKTIKELYKAQQKVFNKDKLEYKAEVRDFPKYFQVFRTTEKPKNIQDFANKLYKTIDVDVFKESVQKAVAGSIVDDIEPNRKYWYLFRTIDQHDLFSNPTNVFEVELVQNSGTVYPIIRVFEFEEEEIPSKTFRKFLQIKPAVAQTLLNEGKSGIKDSAYDVLKNEVDGNIVLGLADESVWGKRIKLRIVSQSSGKTFDLNLTFKSSFVGKNDEDDPIFLKKNQLGLGGIHKRLRDIVRIGEG